MAEAASGAAERTLRHPLTVVAVAGAALAATWISSAHDEVRQWERWVMDWLNDAPDWVAHTMWPIMQAGTLWCPFVVAIVIGIVRRDWYVSAVVVAVGVITWLGAQGVKRIVQRERPFAFFTEIHVREGTGSGLGYLSGHSAMAAAVAVVALSVVPRRWWPVLVLGVAIVGVARIVYGVHLPADVIGGWAFGTLVGVLGLSAVDRHRQRAVPAPPP